LPTGKKAGTNREQQIVMAIEIVVGQRLFVNLVAYKIAIGEVKNKQCFL
jgi:hypothetical protein